jgi:diguanylate cyclase (GGDEF)-like protein
VHVQTLLLSTTFQLVMLVVVSFPAWRGAGGLTVAGPLLAAPPLSLVALGLFAKRAEWSGALTIVVASALLLLGHQLWLMGMYRLCGLARPTARLEFAVAGVCATCVAVLWAVDGSAGSLALAKPRVVANTLPLLVTGLLWARALWRLTPRPWPLGRRYLLWSAGLSLVLHTVRASAYLASPGTVDPVAFQGSVWMVLLVNIVGIFGGVGLIIEAESRTRAALVHANDRLAADALTDPLTGLGNRRRLVAQSPSLVGSARRNAWPVSVMLLDIDHFKSINDRFGHAAGDDVLRRMARLCTDALREHDVLVRWGGEEFAIVLPRCDLEAAERIAERIHGAMRATPAGPDGMAPITASIGIASHLHHEPDFDDAMRRADAAMYRAKSGGRNRSEVHRESLDAVPA